MRLLGLRSESLAQTGAKLVKAPFEFGGRCESEGNEADSHFYSSSFSNASINEQLMSRSVFQTNTFPPSIIQRILLYFSVTLCGRIFHEADSFISHSVLNHCILYFVPLSLPSILTRITNGFFSCCPYSCCYFLRSGLS